MIARIASAFAAVVAMAGASAPAHAQSSPSPYTSAVRYDAMNRVTGTIAPDPDGTGPLGFAATRTTYNGLGLQTKVETGQLANWQSENVAPAVWTGFEPLSSAETSYDVVYRKATVVTRGSDNVITGLVQYSYDTVGRLECTAQRMNPAIYASLPASACTLGTEGSFGPDRITRNVYDAAGQLLKVQKAYATPLQEDHATYTYSVNGKRTSLTDARGYTASMTYDGHDRQVKWNFPSPTTPGVVSTTDYEEYGYDPGGNRTSLRKRDGSTITYQYDALNRNTVKVVPERSGLAATHTRDIYYGYDLQGRQVWARFGSTSGEGVATSYDGFGRMTSSALAMDGTTRTLSYAHDRNGNRTELTWPDAAKINHAYDGLDRMAALYLGVWAGPTTMASIYYNKRGSRLYWASQAGDHEEYGYDAAGRLASLGSNYVAAVGNTAFTYGYTPASQLAQVSRSNDAYAWNGHYNVDRSYAANGLNQYTSAGAATFTYDANGNLTSDGSTTFAYDVENRLVSASGAKNAALRYDPLGRLYETIGASNTTRFLYDGNELVAEYDGSGTMLRRYAHGAGVDDPLLWYEGGTFANPRKLHADHRGSIIGVAEAAGTQLAINSYDEYGIPAAGNVGRFQYTGQAWIPEIGMYYYKARIYSPTLGRFLQTDPIGYNDQVNLYAYVGGDPVNSTDPMGLARICAMQTGSRIQSCVNADGDGDGSSADDDLSRAQVRNFSSSFSGFIANNNGRDIGRMGTAVWGSGSDASTLRVATQFVGAVNPGFWQDRFLIVNNNLSKDTAGQSAWERHAGTGPNGRYDISINMGYGKHRTNMSHLARTLFHEGLHGRESGRYGMDVPVNDRHLGLDAEARHRVMKSGLGGGGCPPIGAWSWPLNLIVGPSYPGC